MSQPILTARNVFRKSSDGRWLLRDVTVELERGQRVALVGPSGSGKSLLLRLLAALDPSDLGELMWHGANIAGPNIPEFRSRCIYLHQSPSLGEGTVEEVLRHPLSFRQHATRKFDRELIVEWLKALDRDASFLHKNVSTLSGGETQIVSLVRAMQLDPLVLLLDEPTSALDAAAAGAIERLVLGWLAAANDRAAVWVSHDEDQARRVANDVWRMRDGQLQPEAVS